MPAAWGRGKGRDAIRRRNMVNLRTELVVEINPESPCVTRPLNPNLSQDSARPSS